MNSSDAVYPPENAARFPIPSERRLGRHSYYTVNCPRCGAPPAYDCVTSSGRPAKGIHEARGWNWRQQKRERQHVASQQRP